MTIKAFAHAAAISVLALAALGASAAGAAPVDLFSTPTPADLAKVAPPPPAASGARERLVAVDPAAIGAASPQELRITLFPGSAATFGQGESEEAFGGGSVWRGTSETGGAATLVVEDGKVTGRVLLGGRVYRVAPVSGRVHRVVELSREKLPPMGPSSPPPAERIVDAPEAPASVPPPPAGMSTVTALYAYTTKARQNSENIRADVNLAVALTNDAYKASKVRMRMRLAGTIEVRGYDEDAVSFNQVLNDLTFDNQPGSAAFAATRQRRATLRADLVVLLREGGEYCGVGWVNIPPDTSYAPDYAYSENNRGCIVYDVVAHEAGHNMGLNHDRYVSSKASKNKYNFGYVNLRRRVTDLMAYTNRCDDRGISCEQLNLFSNPDITAKGEPLGIEKGEAGAADAARWLNRYRGAIEAFR